MNAEPRQPSRLVRWSTWLVAVGIVYVLSSGPVLATAFWLRESTGWNGFYAVLWLYYPLFIFGPDSVLGHYIEWWVKLFGTVGPG